MLLCNWKNLANIFFFQSMIFWFFIQTGFQRTALNLYCLSFPLFFEFIFLSIQGFAIFFLSLQCNFKVWLRSNRNSWFWYKIRRIQLGHEKKYTRVTHIATMFLKTRPLNRGVLLYFLIHLLFSTTPLKYVQKGPTGHFVNLPITYTSQKSNFKISKTFCYTPTLKDFPHTLKKNTILLG